MATSSPPPAEGGHEEYRPFTIDDFGPQNRRAALRRIPSMTLDAVRLVWQAAPRQLAATVVLQVLSAAGTAGQLLVAREILQSLISFSSDGDESQLILPFALFVIVMTAVGTVNALINHQRVLLTEYVARYAFDQIIRVGSRVDYGMLETPRFYDQLQRAIASGNTRITGMVTSLTQLTTGLITSAGIAGVLFLMQPLLVVFVLLAAIPLLIAAVTNSGASYAFEYAMTPEARARGYLMTFVHQPRRREGAPPARSLRPPPWSLRLPLGGAPDSPSRFPAWAACSDPLRIFGKRDRYGNCAGCTHLPPGIGPHRCSRRADGRGRDAAAFGQVRDHDRQRGPAHRSGHVP